MPEVSAAAVVGITAAENAWQHGGSDDRGAAAEAQQHGGARRQHGGSGDSMELSTCATDWWRAPGARALSLVITNLGDEYVVACSEITYCECSLMTVN
mmetsp:Transcript_71442/g.158875  ORF Transcript_71442/g.158875 Transcript_71442/m.158875 type:complete len:98 (+) Transcript_71442:828-1121(+)